MRALSRSHVIGDGMNPKLFEKPRTEKSFIALFMINPVSGMITRDLNHVFIVLVKERTNPGASAATMWDVP